MRLSSPEEWDEAGRGLCLIINTLSSEQRTPEEQKALGMLQDALSILLARKGRFSAGFDPAVMHY